MIPLSGAVKVLLRRRANRWRSIVTLAARRRAAGKIPVKKTVEITYWVRPGGRKDPAVAAAAAPAPPPAAPAPPPGPRKTVYTAKSTGREFPATISAARAREAAGG